jgi:hypothetical protein
MRIEQNRKLFVGVRVDNKLRDALSHCPPRDKVYVDGTDPRYLQQIRGDTNATDSYVGKVIDSGATAVSMDDLKRNVQSILTKVAPGRRSDDDVKVFAVDDGEPPPLPEKPAGDDEDDHGYR